MKKLLFVLLATASLALLGCGEDKSNRISSLDINSEWKHAHIEIGDKVLHVDVEGYSYYSTEQSTVELKTTDYGWIKVHFDNVLLYNSDRCPLDNK